MPFQLDGTSATHEAPFGSVPVKWAIDAAADEPVPAASVRTRTTTRSAFRRQLPRRFTIDLPCSCRRLGRLPAPADDDGIIERCRSPVKHPDTYSRLALLRVRGGALAELPHGDAPPWGRDRR